MKKSTFILVLSVFTCIAVAQDKWEFYTNTNQITDIAEQDSLLWISTKGGLVRFNKTTKTHRLFTSLNSPLRSNSVETVEPDMEGNIWIGTYDMGIAKIEPNINQWNSMDVDFSNNQTFDIKVDKYNNKWIGGAILLKLNNNNVFEKATDLDYKDVQSIIVRDTNDVWMSWTPFWDFNGRAYGEVSRFNGSQKESPPVLNVFGQYKICEDKQKDIWSCHLGGISKFNGVGWNEIRKDSFIIDSERQTQFRYVISDSIGKLYIASDSGIYTYKGTSLSLANNTIPKPQYLIESKEGNVWVGTKNNGLYDLNTSANYMFDSSVLFHNNLSDIYLDKMGDLYISYEYPNGMITHYKKDGNKLQMDLPTNQSNYTTGVTIDTLGNWWIGGSDIIYKYDGITWSNFKRMGFGIGSRAYADKQGRVWFLSTYGITMYDGTGWHQYFTSTASSPELLFTDISEDSTGRIYVSMLSNNNDTATGLAMFENNFFKAYTTQNSLLKHNDVIAIETYNNTVYLLTGSYSGIRDHSLTIIENNNWITYDTTNTNLPLRKVKHFKVNNKGELFFITSDDSYTYSNPEIIKFNGTHWGKAKTTNENIGIEKITNHCVIRDLEFDKDDNLWISTDHGLVKYSEEIIMDSTFRWETATNIQISSSAKTSSIFVYPNPAQDNVTFDFANLPLVTKHIEIRNVLGELVHYVSINSHKTVYNWSLEFNVDRGCYFYKVTCGDYSQSGKIIGIR